jgi:hypothetical protein
MGNMGRAVPGLKHYYVMAFRKHGSKAPHILKLSNRYKSVFSFLIYLSIISRKIIPGIKYLYVWYMR